MKESTKDKAVIIYKKEMDSKPQEKIVPKIKAFMIAKDLIRRNAEVKIRFQ